MILVCFKHISLIKRIMFVIVKTLELKNKSSILPLSGLRLRGCYEGVDGGQLQDSVVDLTGGISETIDIKDKAQIPVDIYEILWRSWKMNSFLGCSISVCTHRPLLRHFRYFY